MADSKIIKGKVVSVQASGNFTAKTGKDAGKTKYKFEVTLDDGSEGQLACLTEELNGTECPVAVGDTAEFNVYPASDPKYLDAWYVRKPKAEGGWKGGGAKTWTPDPEKETRKERWAKQAMITRLACLNTAASLISAGSGASSIENIEGLAEQLEKWVCRGLQLSQFTTPVPVAKSQPTPQPTPAPKPVPVAQNADEDDLPF